MGISIGGSSNKSSSTQTSKPAQWVEDASRRGVGYAEANIMRGPGSYTAPRVAGLTDAERQAGQLAGQDNFTGMLQQGQGALDRVGSITSQWSTSDLESYINPYTKNVLDVANRELGRSYDNQINQLRGQAASRGAFGGSRQALLEQGAQRAFMESQGDLFAKGMADAYDRALAARSGDLSREAQGALSQASGYGQLGQQYAGLTTNQINNLMGYGAAERGVEQAQLDAPYEEFLRQKGVAREDMDRFLASLRAGDYSREGTNTGRQSGSSFGLSLGQ